MDPVLLIQSHLTMERAGEAEDTATISAVTERRAVRRARIGMLEELLSIMAADKGPSAQSSMGTTFGRDTSKDTPFEGVVKSEDSRRGPKGAWRIVMPEMLKQYPTGKFRLTDVEAAAELTAQTMKPETVRSQMSNYVSAGYLDRVDHGVFRFTDKGRVIFSNLSDKPSKLRLVTESPDADDVYAPGVSPEGSDPSKGIATSVSVGRASR